MWSIGFHHDINLFNYYLFPNILGQIIVTASSTWTSSWSHHTTNYRSQADLTRIHPICSATKDLAILVPPWRCPNNLSSQNLFSYYFEFWIHLFYPSVPSLIPFKDRTDMRMPSSPPNPGNSSLSPQGFHGVLGVPMVPGALRWVTLKGVRTEISETRCWVDGYPYQCTGSVDGFPILKWLSIHIFQ